MKRFATAALLLVASLAAQAQAWVDAEVRKLDKPQGKVTLRHGEIRNLELPAMTMVFRVQDPKMLDKLVEGAKVRFAAEKVDGQFTVLRIEPAR